MVRAIAGRTRFRVVYRRSRRDREAKRVKKRKTDREDARLLLRLMREDRFPRIWVPSPENRDVRQLPWHRHRLVQMLTRIMNQLQALEKLALGPWASRRRSELLELLDRLNPHRAIGLRARTQKFVDTSDHLVTLEGLKISEFGSQM